MMVNTARLGCDRGRETTRKRAQKRPETPALIAGVKT
jgi:hypothetical protein